jgi:nucleoporin NUP159
MLTCVSNYDRRLADVCQWLRLVKTNHDATVRVSDKVDLESLPHECNLMAVSNTWGLLVVGSSNGTSIST